MSPGPLLSQYVPVKYDKRKETWNLIQEEVQRAFSHNSEDDLLQRFVFCFYSPSGLETRCGAA